MIKSILVPMTNTENSFAALEAAVKLSKKAGAAVEAFYVRDIDKIIQTHSSTLPYATVSANLGSSSSKIASEEAERRLKREEEFVTSKYRVLTADFDGAKSLKIETGKTAELILNREKAVDLIVMGRSREADNPDTPPLSPIARQVIQKSYHPSLIISKGYMPGNNILLAYDGSRPASSALMDTVIFANLLKARVHVIISGKNRDKNLFYSDTVEQYLKNHQVNLEIYIRETEPVEAIKNVMEETGANFLIMGAYGHRSWKDLIFGSTTEKIIEAVHQPILLSG